MDNLTPDEQAKEDQIQSMLNARGKLNAVGKFKSVKEEAITQKVQTAMPHLTPEEAQEQARRFLWTMCINDWEDIAL
ncbi:MAG TPA: hypothetical protein V6D29_12020 [Leptolyngbyaceae cyanobacterium]